MSRAARRALGPTVVLPAAIFWSTIDRAIVLPLVPTIAADLGNADLAATGWAITGHALAYAVLQLLWGPLQTRWGRIRVLWVSTAIASAAGVASALAPDLTTFVVARVCSGGAFAATFAAVLVYVGDTVPLARRPGAMSNLATATALGLAAGTLGAGALVEVMDWRWIFGGFAVVSAVVALLLCRLPEPRHVGDEAIVPQLRHLARNPVVLGLYAFTALEGALLIGVYNFLPQALQLEGEGAFVAGLTTAAYGVAVVAVSQAMKLVVRRVPPWAFLLAGGLATVIAFAVLLVEITPLSVLAGASLMGVAWALGHTTLQTWMTDAATQARALGMTFFSISLMLGAGLGAALGQLAVAGHAFPTLFLGSLVGAVVLAVAGSVGRRRYRTVEGRDSAT